CNTGQTALFPAAFRGHEALVCLLIDHKADVSVCASLIDLPLSPEQRNERRVRVNELLIFPPPSSQAFRLRSRLGARQPMPP
ncbi:hypothetical protein ABTE05_20665, partial [Acinetobacter baumannii]